MSGVSAQTSRLLAWNEFRILSIWLINQNFWLYFTLTYSYEVKSCAVSCDAIVSHSHFFSSRAVCDPPVKQAWQRRFWFSGVVNWKTEFDSIGRDFNFDKLTKYCLKKSFSNSKSDNFAWAWLIDVLDKFEVDQLCFACYFAVNGFRILYDDSDWRGSWTLSFLNIFAQDEDF